MAGLFSNPELLRNLRAHVRPGRALATAGIILALSLAIGYTLSQGPGANSPIGHWGRTLLEAALATQIVVLTFGGGLSCLLAISREKEMNTFDFQRVTRLTPLELTLGKLFGAPALAYFAALCMMPAALVGAVVGRLRLTWVLAAYALLLICTVAWHAFALVVSLLVERNAAASGGLLYIVLVGIASVRNFGNLGLGQLSPFFAAQLFEPSTWAATSATPVVGGARLVDFFFGQPVHHALVLVVLSLTLLLWFLLAVTSNIKRDPAIYELYTPLQSLGLAVYVNLILVGFLQSEPSGPTNSQRMLLSMNVMLFFALGLAVLRNRDRLRRRLSALGEKASGWLAAFWPATYLLAGSLGIGVATVLWLDAEATTVKDWTLTTGLFRMLFLSVWLARDLLFLQWIYLTRIRRPLVMGVVYLLVYYVCVGVVLGTVGLFTTPSLRPLAAFFSPQFSMGLDPAGWAAHRVWWVASLLGQIPVLCLLAMFHRQKLAELSHHPDTAPAPAD